MAKEFKITSLRLADLEKELNYLKTTRERDRVEKSRKTDIIKEKYAIGR